MLINTVAMTASLMVAEPSCCIACSIKTSPSTMDASPRGPNHPINNTVAELSRVPQRAIATGSMRTTVTLRPA